MIGHCIECGKAYKYWGWFKHHYAKEHPNSKLFFRVKEVMDVHNEEIKAFLELDNRYVGEWIRKC